jgi:hypothetical protein
MKNLAILLLAVVVAMTSCRKESIFTYHATANIYFDLGLVNKNDSLLYTFAYHPEVLQDTVWVPVHISGVRDSGVHRKFSVKVIDTVTTTAQANKHYEPLKSEYIMPAGKGITFIPVIVYNTDTNMVKRSFTINLRIESTEFNTDLRGLTTTRVVISNRLEKPDWWDMWLGTRYSQVKHQLFRLSATTNELTNEGIKAPLYLFYVDQLKAMLANPGNWVSRNPGKGYKLDPRPDGNYDFYPIATPYKIIPYVKDATTGLFYFIDETGNLVI